MNYLEASTGASVLRTPKGAPVVGGDFAFRFERGVPLTLGVLFFSALESPIFDASLGAIVWPALPWSSTAFSVDANGDSALLLDTPAVLDEWCGTQATFQAVSLDPSTPSGLALSNAVRLRIGSVSEPIFFVPEELPASQPVALAFGDVNGDGLEDLVATEKTPSAVVVRLGSLAGLGAPLSTSLTGLDPASITLAHLNADAHLDAIVANASSDDVSAFLGDGTGAFGNEVRFGAGNRPNAVAAGDLNGDLALDLVVANLEDSTVSILIGAGNGSFAGPTHVFAGAGPGGAGIFDVDLVDVDHDGDLDAVATVAFGDLVSVLLGDGLGSLAPPTTLLPTADSPRHLAVGDLNHDSHVDLAVVVVDTASTGPFGTLDHLAVRLGNGNSTFGAELRLDVGTQPLGVEIADMDGDLEPDLVVAGSYGEVSFFLGNGDGTFAPRRKHLVGDRPSCFAIGEVDRDGSLDIVLGKESELMIAFDKDGPLASPREHLEFTPLALDVGRIEAVEDVNGDGLSDLVSHRFAGTAGLLVLLSKGDGTLGPAIFTASSSFEHVVADLDGDGLGDLVFSDPTLVRLGNGDGSFGSPLSVTPNLQSIHVADMNGDLIPDLIGRGNLGKLRVLLGNGDGTFTALPGSLTLPPGSLVDFEIARIDGDPFLDLVVSASGSVFFVPGNGDGSLGAPVVIATVPWTAFAIGDLDGDGKSDLCVPGALPTAGDVWRLLGNGDGTFQPPVAVSDSSSTTHEIELADVDGDGALDIVSTTTTVGAASNLRVQRGRGDGTFATPIDHLFRVVSPLSPLFLGDFDGDGLPDVGVEGLEGFAIALNRVGN